MYYLELEKRFIFIYLRCMSHDIFFSLITFSFGPQFILLIHIICWRKGNDEYKYDVDHESDDDDDVDVIVNVGVESK